MSRIKSSLVFSLSLTLLLSTLTWIALRIAPINALESSQALANWVIAIGAIISAITAIFAARYLYLTLQANEHSTSLLTQQLQQNRAYMVVESTSLTVCYDKDDMGFTHIDVKINWLNTGSSPATNLTTSAEFGPLTPGVEEFINTDLQHKSHAQITLGQGMKSIVKQTLLSSSLAHALAHSPIQAVYLYSSCQYEDIYGNRYQSEYCIAIPIPRELLSSVRHIITSPELIFERFGNRNQEKIIRTIS